MIRSITADKPSFKPVVFKNGLNIVLADRTKESSVKDSTNGLGKSTLIEIIHFCLGGIRGETLTKKRLEDWTFTIELELGGKIYSASRNTTNQNQIIIVGDCSEWPIELEKNDSGNQYLTNNNWKSILGFLMFNIELEYAQEYVPTFRSLISYRIRRGGKVGGYLDPFSQYRQQLTWDIQVNTAYLLDLGWEFASQWQILKDREKILAQIKKESTSGIISDMMGNIGELEAKKIRLSDQIKQDDLELKNFKIHEQYHDIENESNEITHNIHEKINQNIVEKRILENYNLSLKEETDAEPEQVKKVYQEAGLIFSDQISKKLSDVIEFHEKIVSNRTSFLNSEMKKLEQQILIRDQEIKTLSEKRSQLMNILHGYGALDEFQKLMVNHQKIIGDLNDTSIKLENMRKFEQGKSALKIEFELLRQKAESDLSERIQQKENAILTFNQYSNYLYDVPGVLSINVGKNGYKFDIKIERSSSHGYENMKIFCYDLMLAKLWIKKTATIPFVIHDSDIFADVDARQIASALKLAKIESEKDNFQYICTMNKDSIPTDFLEADFDFDSYVRVRFTDASEDGGLLGFRI